MMTEVYIAADNIFSPLGRTTEENFSQLRKNISGIQLHENAAISEQAFQASLFPAGSIANDDLYTPFEQMLISSVRDALGRAGLLPEDPETIFILSTTKGNISFLESENEYLKTADKISLIETAKRIAGHFRFVHTPVVISNACISGSLALITARRLITMGVCKHAVVAGGDLITKFILSGFQSFQAISPEPCKPFDEARKGITLGEGAATMVLSSDSKLSSGIRLEGGSISNDANHISGPSRTGRELYSAISKTLNEAKVKADQVNFISAHGTATIYNDEMEAKAITLAGMQKVPVNSLKGYYGHTLGAAGLIESVIAIRSMKESAVIGTRGFTSHGPTMAINVVRDIQSRRIEYCLKTASGFGGCNAALLFSNH